MKSNLKLAIKTALFGSAMLAATNVSAADTALLDTLLSNGSINSSQHAKLSDSDSSSFLTKEDLKAFDWVKKIKIKGDMRYRYETQWGDKVKSRHRIRARFDVTGKPTDDLKVNMRFATGGSATSTNATLEDGFNQKSFWLDRAYFDYSPAWAQGAHFIGGKMKQQWYQVSNNVWDSDVNPEGLTLKYSAKAGPAKITGIGGYYLVNKQVDGEEAWTSNSNGLQLGHYGVDAAFKFGKNVKWSIGHNGYIYSDASKYDLGGNNAANSEFAIYEIATKLKIKTGLMPITLLAQYSGNAKAQDDAATGDSTGNSWLIGAKTKFKGAKFGYDYRSTEKNAVVESFNDSDFGGGKTDYKGHRVKLGYSFNKYFYLGATYFSATKISDNSAAPREMVQMDIKAKF